MKSLGAAQALSKTGRAVAPGRTPALAPTPALALKLVLTRTPVLALTLALTRTPVPALTLALTGISRPPASCSAWLAWRAGSTWPAPCSAASSSLAWRMPCADVSC